MEKIKEELKDEFNQLRNDDEKFKEMYNENEFENWLEDYNIK